MDFSAILGSLGETLKSFDWQSLIKAISEMAKQLMEMLKPLLGSLTGGEAAPETPATNA